MKALYPSFAPPAKWRDGSRNSSSDARWRALRQKILGRDGYACAYCGFRSEKYQIVDHIDEDPGNNREGNLQVVCQMCNLIKHSGQGCVIVGVVDLYRKSKYSQNEIMRMTHEMRDAGASDARIIHRLGLEERAGFRQDRGYLRALYGFVTSRSSHDEDDMYSKWMAYHKKNLSAHIIADSKQTRLAA